MCKQNREKDRNTAASDLHVPWFLQRREKNRIWFKGAICKNFIVI